MSSKYRRALLALSADPITNGHIDLITDASQLCEELVVLVAVNEAKKYTFDLAERTAMVARAVEQATRNGRVISSEGLLVDAYLEQGCDVLIRGIRDSKDMSYEDEQVTLNRFILPGYEVKYLHADEVSRLISSSLVKAFVGHGLDVDTFVPIFVKQKLEERLRKQYKLGVTGTIASGKTWVAKEIVRVLSKTYAIPATHINLDDLLLRLYAEQSPGGQRLREALAERFGDTVLTADRSGVDRKALAERIFRKTEDGADRRWLIDLTTPHVQRLYRRELAKVTGLVIVEWAQMAEMEMHNWVNCNVIVVDCPEREALIAKRGLDADRISTLAKLQWTAEEKLRRLRGEAETEKNGWVHLHQNRMHADPNEPAHEIEKLAEEILRRFPDLRTLGR
jgi:pantetheine-phosphate adenylyltransferase